MLVITVSLLDLGPDRHFVKSPDTDVDRQEVDLIGGEVVSPTSLGFSLT